MTSWSNWRDHPRMVSSPYVDWWLMQHMLAPGSRPARMVPALSRMDAFHDLQGSAGDVGGFGSDPSHFAPSPDGGELTVFPVPECSANSGFLDAIGSGEGWLPETAGYPTIDEDTLVVGVIDVDIALGHRRFRTAKGNSRVLAAWQQGAPWSGGPAHLPFGHALMQSDIDALLKTHSRGDLARPLDQDGFNRAAHLVDPARPDSGHALAGREAHGTHVMGLVGGADPAAAPTFSDRVRMLVVNLPAASAYGEGGAFLDYYLIYAMRWIVETHARIARASGLSKAPPLLLNISFGKQAGAKDERQVFVREVQKLAKADRILGLSKFNCIMPAGNDNLSRVHARFELPPGTGEVLDWRIRPDDGTSNFVEIWVEKLLHPDTTLAPIHLDIVPPGGVPGAFRPARSGQITELRGGLGRIYCDAVPPEDGKSVRFRYLVCLAPDRFCKGGKVGAAAGKWKIRLRNADRIAHYVRATVQTDQATLPGQRHARRSYFENPRYRLDEDTGRKADTFAYVSRAAAPPDLDTGSILARRGTLNSYAANRFVATIAGHRESDGRPAAYSASGIGQPLHAGGRGAPTVSFPSDDGDAHFGILSDGACDGSVTAMQGTSFACACATRWLIERWLAGRYDPQVDAPDLRTTLKEGPLQVPRPDRWWNAPVGREKVGAGRVSWQPERPVRRC